MLESVFIQTNTTCNARCVICPYKETYAKTGSHFKMKRTLLEKILTDLGPQYAGEIGFYFQYEPLTDKRLPVFLVMARDACPKARITISTNGSLLTDKWHEPLQLCDQVYVNIHAGTKETYEEVQYPLKWDTTIRNVQRFAKRYKGDLFINYVKTKRTEGEIASLHKALPGVQIITDYYASDRAGKTDVDVPVKAPTRFVKGGECQVIGKSLFINYDGTVPLCCELWEREVVIGDVSKENIYDIFDSTKKHDQYELCVKCKNSK